MRLGRAREPRVISAVCTRYVTSYIIENLSRYKGRSLARAASLASLAGWLGKSRRARPRAVAYAIGFVCLTV